MPLNGHSKKKWISNRVSKQKLMTQIRNLIEPAKLSKVALVRKFVGKKMSLVYPVNSIS
jgi:hypothetical protein